MGKKTLLSLFAVIFLLSVSLAASADASSVRTQSKYGILKGEITPQPVRPGEDLLVTVNIVNIDADEAKDIFLVLETEGPFSFKYKTEKEVFIEHLVGVGSFEQDYHLLVDQDAKTGMYDLEVIIKGKDGDTSFRQRIPVKVEGMPDLAVTDPDISKTALTPGDEFNISFTLENKGTGSAKNVRVDAKLKGLPIVPLKDNSEYLEVLAPGELKRIIFPLRISTDAKTTSYQIPLEITSFDETGTETVTSSEMMGIEVLGEALLSIASVTLNPPILSEDQNFFLSIRIGNSGTGEAESVSAELEIPFEGVKKAFISTIKPDEDAPLVFTLKSGQAGSYDYKLKISYRDDLGPHSAVYDLNMYVQEGMFKIFSTKNAIIAVLLSILLFSCIKNYIKRRK